MGEEERKRRAAISPDDGSQASAGTSQAPSRSDVFTKVAPLDMLTESCLGLQAIESVPERAADGDQVASPIMLHDARHGATPAGKKGPR
jgi:hypothetical protein